MTHRWANVAAGLVVAAAASAASPANAAPQPTAPPTAAELEARPLRADRSSNSGRGTPVGVGQAAGDLWHVVGGLGCVIGLAFGLRWAAQKMALVPPVGTRNGNARGVRVVSRTVIGPKQQVLVIQVGRRLIVVGDGGAAGMRPLAEIIDADEVAVVLGEARVADSNPTQPSRASPFGRLFRRAAEPYEAMAANASAAPQPSSAVELPGEVAGLLDRVRGMRQQFER